MGCRFQFTTLAGFHALDAPGGDVADPCPPEAGIRRRSEDAPATVPHAR